MKLMRGSLAVVTLLGAVAIVGCKGSSSEDSAAAPGAAPDSPVPAASTDPTPPSPTPVAETETTDDTAPAAAAPPPAPVENPGPPPAPNNVWAQGAWHYVGGRYLWTRGHWEAQRPGYTLSQARWVEANGKWERHPGRWTKEGGGGERPPAPVERPASAGAPARAPLARELFSTLVTLVPPRVSDERGYGVVEAARAVVVRRFLNGSSALSPRTGTRWPTAGALAPGIPREAPHVS